MPGAERVDRQHESAAPWTVYAATFSPDGRRLAIGGGSWYGRGGIIIVELATGRSQQLRCADLPDARSLGATVSGLCFSACLLYTSDAADERSSVDLGGR